MKPKQKIRLAWLATTMAVLAAIIYNSWPLGYFLNPRVSNGGGLASELEGLKQPYNWLFVVLDVVTGILVVGVTILLWQKRMRLLAKVALVNFALFGLLTIVDALLPMPCAPSTTVCDSWIHQPILIYHGIASIGSGVALFVSAAIVWHLRRVQTGGGVMRVLMLGWCIFGILSFYFFFAPGPGYLSQDYYLVLCGIWMAVMPVMVRHDVLYVRKAKPVPTSPRN